MQLVTQPWTLAALDARDYSRSLSVRRETCGGAQPRCQRCDILLGTERCPNPECETLHGASAGDLWTWCLHAA